MPVPFATFMVLSHCSQMFGVKCTPRAPLLDNIASVLATAYRLLARGVIHNVQLQSLHVEMVAICANDLVQPID